MTELVELPELVVFDCDGTLVDSSQSNRLLYNGIKAALGLPPMTPEEETRAYVQSFATTLEQIIPRELLDRAFEAAEAVDWSYLAGETRLQKGVAEFLRSLKRAGVRRAVNTNSGDEARGTLDHLGLANLFDLIISADGVSRPKPDPEGVRTILRRLETEPGRTVYIGDSMIDQQTAQRAGVVFWAYQGPELEAELHFDDYRELRKTLFPAG